MKTDWINYGRYLKGEPITKFTPTAKKNRTGMKAVLTKKRVKYSDSDPTNVLFIKYLKATGQWEIHKKR